jgi:hypothetical protein
LRLLDAFCGTIHPVLMKNQLRFIKKRQFRIDTNRSREQRRGVSNL